jgi:predicted TPR repeat methyltransferase
MGGPQTQDVIREPMETADEAVRQLTVDEAVGIAIRLQQNDQLAEAHAIYKGIFEVAPEHPVALHYAGVLANQMGRHDEAVGLIEKSLALVPEHADWHNNFGIVLQSHGRFDDAIVAYKRAIALDPAHANAYSNLGVLLRATEKPVEAEEAYRTAIRLNPNHIDAHNNLGILLNSLRRTEEAVACFCRAIVLRPKDPEARRLLALAHCTLGEVDEAIRIFEQWLEDEPGDPLATHMLAACTGRGVPARASDPYVENVFDRFAASFESKLQKLLYRAPRLVGAMLEDAGLPASKTLDVLDVGCGTGLCGPLVAPYARRLTGVDLSAGMLEQAKEKHVYDDLIKGELTTYMRERPAAFDLIVSADTLCYFGALDEAVSATSQALRANGLFIFTLERMVDESVSDYRLELHGRYSHSRSYVERLLAGARLTADIVDADLRMESGVPVAGLVVRAVKRRQAPETHDA